MDRAARRPIAFAAAAGLAALAAGCGGGGSPSGGGTSPPLTAQEQHGKTVFVQSCGSCHKLSDAGTGGTVGKNLDVTSPSYALVLRTLAVPPQNMPTDLVANATDAKAVAAYIVAVTRAR
jgi:mono/diheme cytochrome c family protein